MKRLALFVVAASLFSSLGWAQTQAAVEKASKELRVVTELKAIYAKLGRAFARKDATALAKYLAPGYTASGPDGKTVMDRAKRIADLKRQFTNLDHIHWVPSFNSFKKTAAGTVVSISTHMTATLKDPKGGSHAFVFDGHSEDTWAKGKGGWQEIHVKVLSGSGTLDGHPMGGPPPGHGK